MEFVHLEDNVRYVIDPEKCGSINSDGTTINKQATIYCDECRSYQKLTTRNSIQATPMFNAKQSVYYGLCYTESCLEVMEEKARLKQKDDMFFAQEKYLQSRCNVAEARCNASSIKYGIRTGDYENAEKEFLEMKQLQDVAYNEFMDVKKRIYKENQSKK